MSELEIYQSMFGTAHPNWLVGGLAILGLLWVATWAFRMWLLSVWLFVQNRAAEQKELRR